MKATFVLLAIPAYLCLNALAQDAPEAGAVPAAPPAAKPRPPRIPKPGVSTPGVKREMAAIKPIAVFDTGGTPDWQVVTADGVWVSNGPTNTVHRLDQASNKIGANVAVGKRPCSGVATGFGSVWVPNCVDKTVSRVNLKTNEVEATVPVGPSESEGGITASTDAIWLVTDKAGKLSRIDPKTNTVAATIDIPAGSASCEFADGAVWVTTPEKNTVTRVDAKSNQVTDSIEVGPKPRFITHGAGAVWTLNQGDGTVSRVETKSRKVVASIELGIPGTGGEIAFGGGSVWATAFQIPITQIDVATNTVVRQWVGAGGDSIRYAHGSVWLSNLREHNVWRIDAATLQ